MNYKDVTPVTWYEVWKRSGDIKELKVVKETQQCVFEYHPLYSADHLRRSTKQTKWAKRFRGREEAEAYSKQIKKERSIADWRSGLYAHSEALFEIVKDHLYFREEASKDPSNKVKRDSLEGSCAYLKEIVNLIDEKPL
jgi:hypothetical protein